MRCKCFLLSRQLCKGGNKCSHGVTPKMTGATNKECIHLNNSLSWEVCTHINHYFFCQGSPDSATGRPWMAADIVVQGTACSWMSACFVGINSGNEGGQAFVRSLYQQYASWGVDLSKFHSQPSILRSEWKYASGNNQIEVLAGQASKKAGPWDYLTLRVSFMSITIEISTSVKFKPS